MERKSTRSPTAYNRRELRQSWSGPGRLHFPAGAVRPPRQAHPAFHAECAAGHVVAIVAQDEADAAGDLFGRSQPPPGKLLPARLDLLLREELALAGSIDPARVNCVDANPVVAQLDGRRAGHVVDGGLRHVVGHCGGDGDHRMRRADDGNRAPFSLFHHLQGAGPHAVKRAPHRHVDRAAKAGHIGSNHELTVAVGRIRNEQIDAAEGARRFGDHLIDRLLVGNIGLEQQRLAPQLFDFGFDLFGMLAMRSVVDGDVGPLPRQLDRRRPPDSQRRPRHQRTASRKFHLTRLLGFLKRSAPARKRLIRFVWTAGAARPYNSGRVAVRLGIDQSGTPALRRMPNSSFKFDKRAFAEGSLADEGNDKAYWLSKTPLERLEALEAIRQTVYGYDPATARVQRVLTIIELKRS